MSRQTYLRIFGYVLTIALHVGNIVYMAASRKEEFKDDPYISRFRNMRNRYLTVWTFFLQIIYAISGLSCDILTLKNSSHSDYKLPKHLRRFRDTLFAATVWPSSLLVFTIFWPLFLYDRSLVFPTYLDKIISPISNHIMHTAVLPIVLWEIIFRPRTLPKSHIPYLFHIALHFGLYVSVLMYTYMEKGIWLYPILGKLYGTIYFYMFVIGVIILALIIYYIQWPITKFIWGSEEKSKKKKK